MTITKIDLTNFKAFKQFSISLDGNSYLVGPNNAGKSTVISSIRVCSRLLRMANRLNATGTCFDRSSGKDVAYYKFTSLDLDLVTENLRHEFTTDETRIEMQFSSGHRMAVVWPRTESMENWEGNAYFYIEDRNGKFVSTTKSAKLNLPTIGVIPVLSPVEQNEKVLREDYVKSSRDSRLSSRHFRNRLWILQSSGNYVDFSVFVNKWTPEISIEEIVNRPIAGGVFLDVFFKEPSSRTSRELVWAGDGMQIWLQILLHLFEILQNGIKVVVIDEPDVYLHADLQRRLVRLLGEFQMQTIVATHSSEILGEASSSELVWIEKSRRGSMRAPSDSALAQLSEAIGSQFNIRLAKALKSRLALFVEGKDMKMIRNIANSMGIRSVAEESNMAIIPLGGFSGSPAVEPFTWMMKNFLSDSVRVFLLLDRDFRTDKQVAEMEKCFSNKGIHIHIWRRKELENYLLESTVISRLSGTTPSVVGGYIAEIIEDMRDDVYARMMYERQRSEVKASCHAVNVIKNFDKEFRNSWAKNGGLNLCSGKEILRKVNGKLQENKFKSVTDIGISKSIRKEEIAEEMKEVLLQIDALTRP